VKGVGKFDTLTGAARCLRMGSLQCRGETYRDFSFRVGVCGSAWRGRTCGPLRGFDQTQSSLFDLGTLFIAGANEEVLELGDVRSSMKVNYDDDRPVGDVLRLR